MAHDVIGTAVMVIATAIITATLINAIFPSILGSAVSIKSSGADAGDRTATGLEFLNYEVVSADHLRFDLLNNGRTDVAASEMSLSTVYLGAENSPLALLTYGISGTQVYWTYTLGGADQVWGQRETLVLDVRDPAGSFAEGNYRIRIQLPGGAMSELTFTA